MKIEAELIKAFTSDAAAGNPAGVVHDADLLSAEQMLGVAHTLGFSESAFIQKSDVADYRVRFFSTKQEVDFCGHATVAAFYSLVEHGYIKLEGKDTVEVIQETKAGLFPVACHKNGKIMMTQANPTFGEAEVNRKEIARLLAIHESDLADDLPIQTVSTASPKLIVPVKSLDVLKRIKPDLQGIIRYCREHEPQGFYVFTIAAPIGKADFAARFFNPAVGIDEDSGTGVAAGALACYADRHIFNHTKKQYMIEQGLGMDMPSTLYVDITGSVLVGGYGVSFGTMQLEI